MPLSIASVAYTGLQGLGRATGLLHRAAQVLVHSNAPNQGTAQDTATVSERALDLSHRAGSLSEGEALVALRTAPASYRASLAVVASAEAISEAVLEIVNRGRHGERL